MSAEEYIQELLEERDTLDPSRYGHALRLLNDEMIRVGAPVDKGISRDYQVEQPNVQQYKEEVVKLTEKVMLPVTEFPKFNFVGRLLGPGGSIMKSIADSTRTKISILGKGSTRDKAKEEELSKSEDPKHEHFKEPLHVLVQVEAPKSEGHARLANALEVIKSCLLPSQDDQMHDPMGEMSHPQDGGYTRGPPGGRMDGTPPGRGRGSRGRGRGARLDANPPPRTSAPPRDEYGYLPVSRYDDSGPSRYDHPEARGSFRAGDKRIAPANGYPPKKFRDEPYPAEESYHFNAVRY